MSEQPPDGTDRPRLADAVAEAVRDAMSRAGLSGDALADAVAQALDGLQGLDPGHITVQVLRPDDGTPDIHVVDGGLPRDAPRPARPRPDLHIAGEPPPESPAPAAGLAVEGGIRLDAEERQAVFRGAVVRPYRIACDSGRLAVSVDGTVVEALGPGQTVDVEGGAISVRAADGGARGRYARL